jgi:hypothetical protein
MKVQTRIPLVADTRGNVLITALLLIFACSIMGATVVLLSSTDLKISGNQGRDTESLFTAEAGLAETVHRLSLANPTMSSGVNIAIGDTEPYDPLWRVYVQNTGGSPSQSGSTWYVPSLQDLSGDYLDYTVASGTDGAIMVEHKWEDRDGDGSRDDDEIVRYDPALVPPENFDTGFPIDVVTVTGRSSDARHTLQAEVTRQTLRTKAMGAFYTDRAVEIKGNSSFCGWNHNLSTPVGTRPNVCFSYHESEGNLGGVTTTGDQVKEKGVTHDIEGNPRTDTDPANPWYTLAELLGITEGQLTSLLANPDFTSPQDVMDGVTYIQGDANINAGMVGHGLMYVTGDITINGGFEYWGLIYVEGDGNIIGTPWIIGSVCIKGTADWNFGAGNCGVLYSAEAIKQYVGQLMPMQILAWRDL